LLPLLALCHAAGTVLPAAPTAPPGGIAPPPADPIRAAVDARTQGDLRAAAWHYEQALANPKLPSRTRAAVNVALGLVQLDLGDANLASAAFTRARTSGAPVAPWAAWYEAWADHERGRHAIAARECSAYRANWPTGPHADECLVLMGDAWVAAGERGAAIGAYQTYLQLHPDSPREESLRLGIALAVATTDPRAAIPQLQSLVLEHAYHSTGQTAQEKLDELAQEGFATALPDDLRTQARIAVERKRCGFEEEAWSRYQDLATLAADDPSVRAWIEAQEERFSWGTGQYEALAQRFADAYARRPSAELARDRYKALVRGGLWDAASRQLEAGLSAHGGAMRVDRDTLPRALLLAGRYTEAVAAWDQLAKTGAAVGREARWLAAFASFRAGTHEDALARLDKVVAAGGEEALAARYYRARALDALGRAEEAAAARDAVRAEAPGSWYGLLLRAEGEADGLVRRDGRWPAPQAPVLPPLERVVSGGVASAAPVVTGTRQAGAVDWSALAWTRTGSTSATVEVVAPAAPDSLPTDVLPDSYQPSFLFDPAEADRILRQLAADHPVLPWLGAAADLAGAGVYVAAAPIVARAYDAIEAAREGAAIPDADRLRLVSLPIADWRQVFLYVRDDHHAARFSWGTQKMGATPADRLAALRHQFPTAGIDALYRHGAAYDVDPLLVLGLMRQESVYRQWALSSAGAIGLMQVMPRTGARIAARMGDPHYSPEVLEDPATNVRYGVWYLGRLIDRFEGVWPLAVGSYNGGPHNMSSWLRPWGAGIRMDDFVEQIPYEETRDYVKKVGGYYATYASLYGPDGSFPLVPAHPAGDHPEIVDF